MTELKIWVMDLAQTVLVVGALVAGIAICLTVAWKVWTHRRKKAQEEHSLSLSKSMASADEVSKRNRQLDPKNPWQVFGQVVDGDQGKVTDTLLADSEHTAIDVYGGPGAGKSSSVLVPTILRYPGASSIV